MLAIFLIGLREGLEAVLIVAILLGYLAKLGRRDLLPRVWAGIAVAIAVSLAAGAVLTFGTYGLTFQAQEAIGGGLSIVAVGFVTWMIFWMTRNGAMLSKSIRQDVDRTLVGGAWGVTVLAALSVGREGLETSLFIWTTTQSTGLPPVLAASSVVAGILAAVALGVVITRGLVRVDLRRFFAITGGLLVVVAAGVLGYGLHDLQEAGLLPGLTNTVWNLTAAIPPDSWYGTLLKGFFNFSPEATWLEASAWLLYVAVVGTAFVLAIRHRRPAVAPMPAPAH